MGRHIADRERQAAEGRAADLRALAARVERDRRRFAERRLGQWFGFGLALLPIAVGTWMVAHGREVAGTALVLCSPAGLATAFIYGRASADKH